MKKPAKHTSVRITVVLTNGVYREYAWTTPYGMSRAASTAIKWAKLELQRAKVPGRSAILGYEIDLHEKPGAWRKD